MGLLLQMGYGKGDRLNQLLASRSIEGVVLSPFDETPEAMAESASAALRAGAQVLVDPQGYVNSIRSARPGRLDRHGLALERALGLLSVSDLSDYIDVVLTVASNLSASAVLSPAPIQRGFQDPNTGIALQLAASTLERTSAPVYASCVIDTNALEHWGAAEAWLDQITSLSRLAGVYLVVSRASGTPYPLPLPDHTRTVNLLRLIRRLKYNDLSVIVGYCDAAEGLAALAAGADGFCSGWTVTRKHLIEDRWQQSTGGQQPPVRVWLADALSAIRADEADVVYRDAIGRSALRDRSIRRAAEALGVSGKQSQIDWLRDLGELARAGQTDRPSVLDALIDARSVVATLRSRVPTIDATHAARLDGVIRAVRELQIVEGMD